MLTFASVDDVRGSVGTDLGTSRWCRIDQDRIATFAAATDDDQWIHVDPDRAATGPYGTTIAHGFLTLSLIPFLVRDIYRLENTTMSVNYGMDRVRFPAPVPVGSKIALNTTLVSVEDAGSAVHLKLRHTVLIEGAAKPACVVDYISRVVFDSSET